MKVFVTKYACTEGVLEFEAKEVDVNNPKHVTVYDPAGIGKVNHFYKPYWYLDAEEAMAHAVKMRERKANVLRLQALRLEGVKPKFQHIS